MGRRGPVPGPRPDRAPPARRARRRRSGSPSSSRRGRRTPGSSPGGARWRRRGAPTVGRSRRRADRAPQRDVARWSQERCSSAWRDLLRRLYTLVSARPWSVQEQRSCPGNHFSCGRARRCAGAREWVAGAVLSERRHRGRIAPSKFCQAEKYGTDTIVLQPLKAAFREPAPHRARRRLVFSAASSTRLKSSTWPLCFGLVRLLAYLLPVTPST